MVKEMLTENDVDLKPATIIEVNPFGERKGSLEAETLLRHVTERYVAM